MGYQYKELKGTVQNMRKAHKGTSNSDVRQSLGPSSNLKEAPVFILTSHVPVGRERGSRWKEDLWGGLHLSRPLSSGPLFPLNTSTASNKHPEDPFG